MVFGLISSIICIVTIISQQMIYLCDEITTTNAAPQWTNSPAHILHQKSKRPPNGKRPLPVHVGLYIESLGKFQATEMSFDVDLYLYSSWQDPTMSHDESDYILVNDARVLHEIWLPDLYFANARSAQFHSVTIPNFNMFIRSDGTIAYSSRVTLNVACNLNLKNYPMDYQLCLIRILSYAYIANQINVTWFSFAPIRYNPEIGLPEFTITGITHDYCDGTYNYAITEEDYKTDRFSCLVGIIHLRRSIGYHLVQSYIPTGLIVIVSWVSFWIVPARVTLSFTTLLTLSTLGNGLRFGLPQVSYAKAIDYWFGACMVFIFGALLEFAIVNSLMRQANKFEHLANCVSRTSSGRRKHRQPMGKKKKYQTKFGNQSVRYTRHDRIVSAEVDDNEDDEIKLSINNNNHHNQQQSSDMIYSDGSYQRRPVKLFKQMIIFLKLSHEPPDERQTGNDDGGDDSSNSEDLIELCGAPFNYYGYNHFIRLGMRYSQRALRVDIGSRILFPLLFIIFNSIYWSMYLWFIQQSE